MAAGKFDFKKEYKDLYLPGQEPVLVDVPAMNFIMIDGNGAPSSPGYRNAVSALYALTFMIKMSKMSGRQPEGYYEYVVPPLEGLWQIPGGSFDPSEKNNFVWTSMIRQPDFVTPRVFEWAADECREKKPEIDISGTRFESYTEGLCVQIMHVGSYDHEAISFEKIARFIEVNGLDSDMDRGGRHHEVYLGDPRKAEPAKLRTVLRVPVRRL